MKVKQYMPMIDKIGKTVIQETGTAYNVDGRTKFNSPDLLADFFGNTIGLKNCATEYLYIAVFNNALKMIGCFQASAGNSNTSLFPVREILQNTLLIGGNGIAICHNHPSGNIDPSEAARGSWSDFQRFGDGFDLKGQKAVKSGQNALSQTFTRKQNCGNPQNFNFYPKI